MVWRWGVWGGRLYTCCYTVTTRMTPALRWPAMRAILIFHNCEGQSHKTVSTDHNFWRERRAEADSNRGPSAYQPNALPLGHTGSRFFFLFSFFLSCCLTSTEARWPIRDGDRVGRGRKSERLDRWNRPKKTGETVDRRQNNGSVKAVSSRHCPATCAPCNCSFNCCAGQSH